MINPLNLPQDCRKRGKVQRSQHEATKHTITKRRKRPYDPKSDKLVMKNYIKFLERNNDSK